MSPEADITTVPNVDRRSQSPVQLRNKEKQTSDFMRSNTTAIIAMTKAEKKAHTRVTRKRNLQINGSLTKQSRIGKL
jgi:hypothetical protein